MGSVLDGGEGGVRLQEVGDDLSTLHFQVVAAETANEKGVGLSMAADSNGKASAANGGVLERFGRCV